MSTLLFVLGTILYFLVCVGGLGLLIAGLPGTWLIVAASAVYAWQTHGEIPWVAVVIFIILSLLAEVFEAVVGAWGAKKYGGTRWGMLGAITGGIAGAIILSGLLPVIGTIMGAFLGAFAGAFVLEYFSNRDFRQARRSGTGAFFGKLIAVVVKGGLAVAMIISAFALIVLR